MSLELRRPNHRLQLAGLRRARPPLWPRLLLGRSGGVHLWDGGRVPAAEARFVRLCEQRSIPGGPNVEPPSGYTVRLRPAWTKATAPFLNCGVKVRRTRGVFLGRGTLLLEPSY